ncbi:DNA polymerase III subunit beta [Natronospirillum operosum]|uniref:Beta sliding clamp n=1 Tax=Natronospirillum operosum TaxID=2759953 RepID=A0A4Z0W613_9GAMM|nr:DNA polymerase III subunit beta [Natronospirillum operosum]TGG91504.1 DNA polymerase III subunit beta [Natronospirillum operosum]
MNLNVSREALLKPLQFVAGVVEKRNTLAILANVLLEAEGDTLTLTGTDLEVELVARVPLETPAPQAWRVTLPARKLLDLCKSLPAESQLQFSSEGERVLLTSGRSRYSLSTLPATEFPNIQTDEQASELFIPQSALLRIIDATTFAMAVQDVRYYLNGMLLELKDRQLRTVATDGHRLAMAAVNSEDPVPGVQVIVPRKGVLEMQRILEDTDSPVRLTLTTNHLRATVEQYTFTTKLVDGKFPDYERVIPRGGDKEIVADKDSLRLVLTRAAILSNEKYRGVRLTVTSGNLQVLANNPEQEEAEENLPVDYEGETLEVGFNVNYLIDVLNAIKGEQVLIKAADANSSALVRDFDDETALYVVMPMRL